MASLKKPESCTCGSIELVKHKYPERWVCSKCDRVLVSRSKKNDPNKCRECGVSRSETKFRSNSNICLKCLSEYNKKYREENEEELKIKRRTSYRRNKERRKGSVRKAIQRSPDAFIRNLLHHITKKCNRKKAKSGKLNPQCLNVTIDYDYLMKLYDKQNHKCALSGLLMTFEFNNPRSISVDRIDSDHGYEIGNVQLVCQAFNLMKNKYDQDDIVAILDDYYKHRAKEGDTVRSS